MNHVANLEKWLKVMELPRIVPSYGKVDTTKCPDYVSDAAFLKAKIKVLEYLKANNTTVVRDHCHLVVG